MKFLPSLFPFFRLRGDFVLKRTGLQRRKEKGKLSAEKPGSEVAFTGHRVPPG